MFVRKGTRHSAFSAFAAAALCLLSSCAGTKDVSGTQPELPVSDAALLESSEGNATDVSDSSIFADLNKAEPPEGMEVSSSGKPSSASDSSAGSGEGTAFYQPIGGESIGRVAYTLYGNVSYAKKLLKKNPDLKGVKRLTAEQKVFFDIEGARPQPTYLTKDLLNRYPTQLSERLSSIGTKEGLSRNAVTVTAGDTLQKISQKLYGTSRYWPEIFLINYEKIQNYDRIPAGISLSVFAHTAAAAQSRGKKEEAPMEVPIVAPSGGAILAPLPAEKTVTAPPKVEAPAPAPVAAQPVAATQPPPAPALDPIPETPAPMPVASVAEKGTEPTVKNEDFFSSNATMRRVLYGSLVALIAGIAFYLTRNKRRPKFDMLDMTAAETSARPKLGSLKDSQKHGIS